jgi:surfeit locus 1 family protein
MSLARWRAAGLVWPSVMTILGFAVLVGLGTWQLQRKTWKEDLIAAVEARVGAPPRPLDTVDLADPGPVGAEYTRVTATGRFVHGEERYFYMPGRGGPGWLVITPLVRDDGSAVLVNRGWVPDRLRDPSTRPAGQTTGPVTVVGLLRRPDPEPGWFAAQNDPARRLWYWRDIEGMWRCRPGTDATPDCRTLTTATRRLPLMIDAAAEPANPGGWPRGGTTRLDIPNRHLEYVLTWYGLAATLLAVFAAFAVTRLRAVRD